MIRKLTLITAITIIGVPPLTGFAMAGVSLANGTHHHQAISIYPQDKPQKMYSATEKKPIKSSPHHSSNNGNGSKPKGSIHVSTQGVNGQPIRIHINCSSTKSMTQCKQIAKSIMAKASQMQQAHVHHATPKTRHNLDQRQGSKRKQSNR